MKRGVDGSEELAKVVAAMVKLKQIEALKNRISDLRDQLRTAISDVEDICGSLEYAEQRIDNGLDELRSGLEDMSGYL